jgi:hypothetical protein
VTIKDATNQLQSLKYWKQVEEIFRLGTFKQLSTIEPAKELYESFLIQGLNLKNVPITYAPAVAVAYRWF